MKIASVDWRSSNAQHIIVDTQAAITKPPTHTYANILRNTLNKTKSALTVQYRFHSLHTAYLCSPFFQLLIFLCVYSLGGPYISISIFTVFVLFT